MRKLEKIEFLLKLQDINEAFELVDVVVLGGGFSEGDFLGNLRELKVFVASTEEGS